MAKETVPVTMFHTEFADSFSQEIFDQTYAYVSDSGERETIDDTHHRVATELAKVEKNPDDWYIKFRMILHNFSFVPGGRITSNAGTGLKGTSYINCFVSGAEETETDVDSMEGILRELHRQAMILKSEGGYGICANFMRPRGAFIYGIGNSSPGAVKMLEMWDTQSSVITAGSGKENEVKKSKQKIRKGAQMVTMSDWHPDIHEFITAKQTAGQLTKFNMSVLISDDFMEAVKTHSEWVLEYPDYSVATEQYKRHWKGDLKDWKKRGLPTKVYKRYKDANELWDLITDSTYNRNEPGVLFIDTMNRKNNLWYTEHINATNPCGEQVLPPGGVCLLGSMNLTQFVSSEPNEVWDYKKLDEYIPIAVRFLDNVNDISYVPLEQQKKNMIEKRRIGLGILGYASALLLKKIPYGSKKCLEVTEELMKYFTNKAYQSSVQLAREKGAFKRFDREKYLQSKFIKMALTDETKELIAKYGIRNSHLTSIQPTGNSSVYANNVSGGLEPIFLTEYIRTTIFPYPPEGLGLPTAIDYSSKNFKEPENNTVWEWTQEGDTNLLRTKFNGQVWKMDANRGLLRETLVQDYAVRKLKEENEWEPTADYVRTTMSLSVEEHISVMAVFSRYICSALSKTLNVPSDYPYSDFKKVYKLAHETGTIKGITTYRAGTMTSVLASVDSPSKNKTIKRPESVDCDIHIFRADREEWVVLVGILNDVPYEVFAFKQKDISFTSNLTKGKLVKCQKSDDVKYNLVTDYIVIEDIQKHFERREQETVTRMISLSLKNGIDISEIYRQLVKTEAGVMSFGKAIARTLSGYVKEWKETECKSCGDQNGMQFTEGCLKCKNCGDSKCL